MPRLLLGFLRTALAGQTSRRGAIPSVATYLSSSVCNTQCPCPHYSVQRPLVVSIERLQITQHVFLLCNAGELKRERIQVAAAKDRSLCSSDKRRPLGKGVEEVDSLTGA